MSRRRALIPAALLALTVAAAPTPARGCTQGSGACFIPVFYLYIGVGALGVVADVAEAVSLLETGYVSRFASGSGVAIWVVEAFVTVPGGIAALLDPGMNGRDRLVGLALGGLTAASLALSIYSATRPPPVTVAPTAFRAPDGATVPGLALSLRW